MLSENLVTLAWALRAASHSMYTESSPKLSLLRPDDVSNASVLPLATETAEEQGIVRETANYRAQATSAIEGMSVGPRAGHLTHAQALLWRPWHLAAFCSYHEPMAKNEVNLGLSSLNRILSGETCVSRRP